MADKPLIVENVTRVYANPMLPWKKTVAVDAISFSIEPGEIIGFVGHNGAGKTTTVKMCMGFISPTSGSISVYGKTPDNVDVKRKIGFLPERPYFYMQLSGEELLSYFAGLSGIKKSFRKGIIEKALKRTGIWDARNSRLSSYSKGMLQRIGLAQALLHDPEFIIMDEPMSGLDPLGRKEVKDLIRDLGKEGRTVLFSSHIMSDIEDLSDKILIIEKGKIGAFGRLKDIVDVSDIHYKVVFTAPEEKRQTVFGIIPGAVLGIDTFTVTTDTEKEMNRIVLSVIEKGFTLVSAGTVYPTLEEYVFKLERRERQI